MKRFSRLQYAAKTLKATGPVITKYQAFRSGTATYNATSQARQGTVKIGIRAFGVLAATPAAATIYASGVTGRANAQITANGLSALTLGHRDIDTANTPSAGFNSAKLIVAVVNNASTTTPVSQITGLEYKKAATESYTFPFGATDADAATEGQYEAFQRLGGQVAGVAPATGISRRVSFRPEAFRLR